MSGNIRYSCEDKGMVSENGKVVAARSPLLKRQQTGNRIGVGKQAGDFDVRLTQDGYWRSCMLFAYDPFHEMVNAPFRVVLIWFLLLYVFCWLIFAPVYMLISDACNLEADTFLAAFYYSLITMSTIGFGTPDMTFNGCSYALFAVGIQSLLGTALNATLAGLLFAKFSRATKRSTTIIFSEKAVIRRIQGSLFFQFQVFDSRPRNSLAQATVRCHAIRHATARDRGWAHVAGSTTANREGRTLFQQHNMRLCHPDDELGAFLFLAIPATVVHRIDPWSPLAPPRQPSVEKREIGVNYRCYFHMKL